jgi:hypothetical protein
LTGRDAISGRHARERERERERERASSGFIGWDYKTEITAEQVLSKECCTLDIGY